MSGRKDSDERMYVDMMARPEMVSIEVGEQSLDLSREEARAVALLLKGYLKLRWQADEEGYPDLVEPGKRAGPPPTKPLHRGLWQRPLSIDQPAEEDRLPAEHDGIFSRREKPDN